MDDTQLELVLNEWEIRDLPTDPREFIVDNLILQRTINIINGPRGCGKSWLAFGLANCAMGRIHVGPWNPILKNVVNVMIVDGELPIDEIISRNISMACGIGGRGKMYFYADAYTQRMGAPHINLCSERIRDYIHEQIHNKKIGMVVFDNLSALCPGIDENDKKEFDDINRWMMDLRYEGVTILEVHHTGKSGDQRGTSAHEDHVDLSLTISRPANYSSKDGCKIIVSPSKDRNFVFKYDNVYLRLKHDDPYGVCEHYPEESNYLILSEFGIEEAKALLKHNPSATEKQALGMGISSSSFFRAKKELKGG